MERQLTLRKCEGFEDWYAIEWAEHANHHWLEPTAYGARFMYSGRICDADVEGPAAEMLALAEAIEQGKRESFKRCEVYPRTGGGWGLSSPRNSQEHAVITDTQAKQLASEIRRVIAAEAVSNPS